MMKQKVMVTLLMSTMIVILSACGWFGDDNGDETAMADAIIVYTNQTSGGRETRLQTLISEANLGFSVEFVELAGQNLRSRLIAEKNFPIADVVLGGGVLEHLGLKNEGVTTPFFPTWLDTVDSVH
ncbi:MAG: hypothetical protein EA374_00055, partial [Acholeplasmatales bacterium]